MKRLVSLVTIIALLALAGCGGSDSTDSTGASGAAGASGQSDTSGDASYDITVGEWVAALEDEKTQILKDYVADTPSCNAEVDKGFVLTVAATSTDAQPDSPLPELIDKSC
jgi:hypothetical protein